MTNATARTTAESLPSTPNRDAARIALAYFAFAAAWIFLSDSLLERLVANLHQAAWWSTVKGWAFVCITALLLFSALRKSFSKLHQTQRSLIDSEARYRILSENSADVIWSFDVHTNRFTYVSPSVHRLRGYSADEVIAQSLEQAFTPESHQFLVEHLPRRIEAFEAGNEVARVKTFQLDQTRREGPPVPTEVVTTLVTDNTGRVVQVIGVSRGITERLRAEQALRESEERFRAAFDEAAVGMCLTGLDARVFRVNQAMCAMLGYTAYELHGRTWIDITHPEDREGSRSAVQRLLDGKVSRISLEKRYLHKSEEPVWVQMSATLLRNAAGEPLYFITHLQDITSRKQAERSLHELSGRLLRLQDEERRRIARELHDTTSQNLAALNMSLALLRDSINPDDPRTAQALADCVDLVKRSTEEIRTLSYLLHPPVLDFVGLPAALRDLVSGFGKRSGITAEIQVSDNFGRLPRETETALFRVAQEGLANILRHSGSKTARLSLQRQEQRVVLEIGDTGKGIVADKLSALAEGTASLGVGVAGMQERLLQLGGRLQIESDASGTTVRAVLTTEFRT